MRGGFRRRLAGASVAVICSTAVALAAPSSSQANVGAGNTRADGLDGCQGYSQPSTAQMQSFWNGTPYYDWFVYIGGSAAYCGPGGVNGNWFTTVANQGWALTQIWVGPQAPCSSIGGISWDTATANSQGFAEARAANQQSLYNFGIPAGGVIYYDMEAYPASSACDAAVQAFVSGWDQQLEGLSQYAGLYSTPYVINITVPISYNPESVWAATYNGANNVWGWAYLGDPAYVFDQRANQYNSSHNETWNGVTLNVDNDCANARTLYNNWEDTAGTEAEGWPGEVQEDASC